MCIGLHRTGVHAGVVFQEPHEARNTPRVIGGTAGDKTSWSTPSGKLHDSLGALGKEGNRAAGGSAFAYDYSWRGDCGLDPIATRGQASMGIMDIYL